MSDVSDLNESDPSPFRPGFGLDPPRFAGREELFHAILVGLRQGPTGPAFHHIVTGGRGTGKTVLLTHLHDYVIDEWGWSALMWAARPTWPLAQALADEADRLDRELQSSMRRLGSKVRPDTVEAKVPGASITKRLEPAHLAKSVTATLRDLGELAAKRNRGLVLVVDELQAASPGDIGELSGSLQIVASQLRLPVALIAAGLPDTKRVIRSVPGTTFMERQDVAAITNLDLAATRDALEIPIITNGRDIDPDALDALVDATDGYPYAIQLAGHHTWNAAGDADTITAVHAATGIERMRRHLDDNLYTARWDELTPMERSYVTAAAELATARVATADVAHALGRSQKECSVTRDRLISVRHVLRADGHGYVAFDIPGFDTWVLEHTNIEPDPTQRKRREETEDARRDPLSLQRPTPARAVPTRGPVGASVGTTGAPTTKSALVVGHQPTTPDEDGTLTLHVSNQSFADDPVDITVLIDGVVVVDGDFSVEGQHNWVVFELGVAPGDHELTMRSSSGVEASAALSIPDRGRRWAVVSYWYDPPDPDRSDAGHTPRGFSYTVDDEPIAFG